MIQRCCFFELLTLAVRPLVFPAPHAIGQALDVGGAQSEVSGVAGEDDSSAVLVVRAVDDPPAPVLQGKGADAGTHHHCRGRRRGNNTVNCVIRSVLLNELQRLKKYHQPEEHHAKIPTHLFYMLLKCLLLF